MTNASMTPGSRPRRGVIGVAALLGAGALTAVVALAVGESTGSPQVAGAVELDTFTSCDDLAAWGAEAMGLTSSDGSVTATTVAEFRNVGGEVEGLAAPTAAADSTSSGGAQARSDEDSGGDGGAAVADGTNVAVEGVDEVDLVDRLTDEVALVATAGTLALVDLAAGEVVEQARVPYDAQVTYDAEAGVVWVVGSSEDGAGTAVERYAVTTTSLEREGGWTTSGYLVDARRVGGELHVVATEGFGMAEPVPVDPSPPGSAVPLPEPETTVPAPAETVPSETVPAAGPAETTTVPPDATEPRPEGAEPGAAEPGSSGAPGVAVDPAVPTTEPGAASSGGDTPGADDGVAAPDTTTTRGGPGVAPPRPPPPPPAPPPPPEPPVTEPAPEPEVTVPFPDGPVDCDTVLHPEGPADPSATLLVTLPATGEVAPVRSAQVVGSGQLVHVTTDAVFLATPQWDQDGPRTGIHRFDLATLQPTGSGTVEGSLLDDFSMSEHDGVLRVATTQGGGGVCCFGRPIAVEGDGGVGIAVEGRTDEAVVADPATPEDVAPEGLNEIVTLDTEGALDEVGRTEPFGHAGETLHGIRFAGTTAYAVTFLQTDPFYVVDLRAPADPQVVGEVELPGFSSYLHPISDDLVVGFGPDGAGRASAKLFDVSDPTAPTVVDDLALGDDSPVQYDHHAFVDRGEGRFAVPALQYDSQQTSSVVEVDTRGGRLDVVEQIDVPGIDGAQRIIPVDESWALLGDESITLLDGSGGVRGTISLT